MFLKAIPFILVYMVFTFFITLTGVWASSLIRIFIEIFVIPILIVHFMNKETVGSLFEFKIIKSVFDNFGDYVMVILKSIALAIVFIFLIIVLVGIPAGQFTKSIFLADFYRRRMK